jgi:hypothetical protein
LVLKFVQVGNRTVRKVGRFKDKTFGDVTAAPERIEQNQIVYEKSIRGAFKHESDALGFHGDARRRLLPQFIADLFNPRQVFHELWHGANRPGVVDSDVGFLNVRQRPFQVFAGNGAKAAFMQTAAQAGFGGAKLAQQRLSPAFQLA